MKVWRSYGPSSVRRFCAAFAAALLFFAGLALAALPALASCAGMAEIDARFMRVAATEGAVPSGSLRITFIGHASFEVESPEGVRVVTDYNGYVSPSRVPDIVTMNNAHDSHYTDFVDKNIKYVLRGWDPGGGVARHNISFRDVRVRSVPTNLSTMDGRLTNGNSMFVIEAQGLCVVHISHVHHALSPDQLRELGFIDVAFAPIDGTWTMSHDELFEALDKIKPRLIIPMHYGSPGGVEAFVARAKAKYRVREHDSSTILVNLRMLPREPEVLFLQGR